MKWLELEALHNSQKGEEIKIAFFADYHLYRVHLKSHRVMRIAFYFMNKTEKVQSKTARQLCDLKNLLGSNKHV